MTVTKEHIRIMREAKNYRIKQVIDPDGYSSYYIQRRRFNKWWNVYIVGKYDATPWILEFIFGEPKEFHKFEDAKAWIMRRLSGKDTIYHYYPFESNNN